MEVLIEKIYLKRQARNNSYSDPKFLSKDWLSIIDAARRFNWQHPLLNDPYAAYNGLDVTEGDAHALAQSLRRWIESLREDFEDTYDPESVELFRQDLANNPADAAEVIARHLFDDDDWRFPFVMFCENNSFRILPHQGRQIPIGREEWSEAVDFAFEIGWNPANLREFYLAVDHVVDVTDGDAWSLAESLNQWVAAEQQEFDNPERDDESIEARKKIDEEIAQLGGDNTGDEMPSIDEINTEQFERLYGWIGGFIKFCESGGFRILPDADRHPTT